MADIQRMVRRRRQDKPILFPRGRQLAKGREIGFQIRGGFPVLSWVCEKDVTSQTGEVMSGCEGVGIISRRCTTGVRTESKAEAG